MANPFSSDSNTEILKEAFPLLELTVIEDVLYTAKGDINEAFEMLFEMTNDNDKTKVPPHLPVRRSYNTQREHPNHSLNPFLNNGVAKPLTVREELAQWRQDLRDESRRKAALRSNSNSLISSVSSSLRSHASMSSLSSHHSNTSTRSAHGSLQRPIIPTSRTYNSLRSSISSPSVNYHNRNHSIPNGTYSSLSPPALPLRRHHSSLTSNTNPFIVTTLNQPQSNTSPNTNNHRQSTSLLDAEAPALNPFEVPEFPPPPYSEISADTIIHPQ